jgi:hypothetical protein
MRLTGPLLNPSVLSRMEAAARARTRIDQAPGKTKQDERPVLRARMGAIQGAVLEIMGAAAAPMSPREIHASVELQLKRRVPHGSVWSALSVLARDPRSGVVRPVPHRYRLTPTLPNGRGEASARQC